MGIVDHALVLVPCLLFQCLTLTALNHPDIPQDLLQVKDAPVSTTVARLQHKKDRSHVGRNHAVYSAMKYVTHAPYMCAHLMESQKPNVTELILVEMSNRTKNHAVQQPTVHHLVNGVHGDNALGLKRKLNHLLI